MRSPYDENLALHKPYFREDPDPSWSARLEREVVPHIAGPCARAWRTARGLFLAALPTRADRLTALFLFAAAVWIGGFVVPALFHVPTGAR